MKTLYIFVTSDRPDQYLNPIVYCINKEQVRRIIFVEIKNPHAGKQVEASSICRDVYDLAYQLSQGKYKYYVGNARGNEVSLDPHYSNSEILKLRNQYDSYLVGGISWDSHTVDYTCLKQFIYNLNNLKGQGYFILNKSFSMLRLKPARR